MKNPVPPLNPLRVFEVAARCATFTEAARELLVTQAAVSRQITVLEGFYGVKLFDREQRNLALTPEGRQLSRQIAPAFDMITQASADLLSRQEETAVTIRTYPTFAAKWLMPRLETFLLKNSKFNVHIQGAVRPPDFSREGSDVLIRFGSRPSDDFTSFPLCADRISPACSPELMQQFRDDPAELIRAARLLRSKYRQSDWTEWARHAGYEFEGARFMNFDSSILAYQAALDGLGVVVAQLALIASDLHKGTLMLPQTKPLERGFYYWCLYPKHRRLKKPSRQIVEWLRSEAEPNSPAMPT